MKHIRINLLRYKRIAMIIAAISLWMTINAQISRLDDGVITKDLLPPVTEESKDEAYDKPAASLVGTWYRTTQEQVYKFDANGLVTWSFPFRKIEGIQIWLTHQWTWKKKGDRLILSNIAGKGVSYKIDPSQQSDYNALSARKKNIIQEFIKSQNSLARPLPGVPMEIKMLTDDIMVLNRDYYIKNTSVDKFLKAIEDKKTEEKRLEKEISYQNSVASEETVKEVEKLEEDNENEPIYDEVDEWPRIKDSNKNIMKYLISQLVYPTAASENNIQGNVKVRFAVMKDGSVDKVHIKQSIHPYLDEEAVRVVKRLPKLIPGKKNGQPVKVWLTFTARFKLQ